MSSETVLIIGACGQIGSELTLALAKNYKVIAADVKEPHKDIQSVSQFEKINVLNGIELEDVVRRHRVTQIYHLAALLSATGEKNPELAWNINMGGLMNVLNVCVEHKIHKLFWPSTIAAFGITTPMQNTPQHTITEPTTMYGITKVAGELLCQYYHKTKNVDVRSIRYPGLISYKTQAGGGTTDYAVDIYFEAKKHKKYTCFLAEDTVLPMMYMPDAIRGTIDLMEAPADKIKIRTSYNFAGMSFNPNDVAQSIKKHIPDFTIDYAPDFRQAIAATWPQSIDDSVAREQWGWKPEYNLDNMTADMLDHISL